MRSSIPASASSQPVSFRRDLNRVLLYKTSSTSKRRSKGDAVHFRWLSLCISLLICLVCLGGLLSLYLNPHPREGDIVVDDVLGLGRKELVTSRDGEDLYAILEALVDIDGHRLEPGDVRDKVLLISNVASQCGYTASNYASFRDLLEKHYAAGLRVIAQPCNDFGQQERGSDEEIRRFVRETYDKPSSPITLLKKMEESINGESVLFRYLREHSGADGLGVVTWNFNKWLIGRDGIVRRRYDSADHKEDLDADIQGLL